MPQISFTVNKGNIIQIDQFSYNLPENRIAKYPLETRDESKLLVYKQGVIEESRFSDISKFLPSNSRLIFNNTKVIHARLEFIKITGAAIEIFCLSPHDPVDYQLSFSQMSSCTWKCMVGNLKKWKTGKLNYEVELSGKKIRLEAEKAGMIEESILVRFTWNVEISFGELLEILGRIPIPPYLKRPSEDIDTTRYQTIYSSLEGSVAAPTAGLHFTENVFTSLKKKNISFKEVTLHVGAGTFQPVKSESALDHTMHREFFSVSRELISSLAKKSDPLVSTGTTTLRTLESLYWLGLKSIATRKVHTRLEQWDDHKMEAEIPANQVFSSFAELLEKKGIEEYHAETQIMIVPGYTFKVVDALITNYHQPGSTLLLLVAAFIGEDWRKVYNYSLNHDFRFLSYGDSSLLWR